MNWQTKRRCERGFTLLEMMFVVGLLGVLASMAMFELGSARPSMLADGGMRVIMAELNAARENAIVQRRQMEITFVGANTIRITRHDIPTGTTVLRQITFESGVTYGLIEGVPDSPDAFGNDSATYFGSAQTLMFTSDGSLIDNAGMPVNGTIFIQLAGQPQSYRAITVLGTTGRVRAFRWNGTSWTRV